MTASSSAPGTPRPGPRACARGSGAPGAITRLASQLPPDALLSPAPLLARVAKELRKGDETLRVIPLARFAQGSSQPDELRLLVMPKTPLRGVTAIEIGVSYSAGEGGALACPEVLVRTVEDSVACKKLGRSIGAAHWLKGKKPGERVFVLEPKLPTWRMTVALASRLAQSLAEPVRSAVKEAAPSSVRSQPAGASKAASSAGKGASAKKAFTTSLPSKATEAACSA